MATNDRGLGSDNMSQEDKDKIHRMGGEASGGSNSKSNAKSGSSTISNRKGGGALTKEDQRKGGRS